MQEPFYLKYHISSYDLHRPWGGFYCISPSDLHSFILDYFPSLSFDTSLSLSPKILIINPHQRLSWQYHNRRREIWSVILGPVGIIKNSTDFETPVVTYQTGDIIHIDVHERHRIVGLTSHAFIAELWSHVDPSNPSDEFDIIRLQDDYSR